MKNYQIEKQRELIDEDIVSLVERQIKRHKESIEGFEKGGRIELAEKEKQELEILKTYLPEQISEEEIRKEVEKAVVFTGATAMSDMGKVMSALSHLRGKADMGLVSLIVKQKLTP